MCGVVKKIRFTGTDPVLPYLIYRNFFTFTCSFIDRFTYYIWVLNMLAFPEFKTAFHVLLLIHRFMQLLLTALLQIEACSSA